MILRVFYMSIGLMICLFFSLLSVDRSKKNSIKHATTNSGTKRIMGTIRIDDYTRRYILHVPENLENASQVPLVFVLHGARSNPETIEKMTEFHAQQTAQPFITVYPASKGEFWDDGRAGVSPNINDIKFVNTLIDTLEGQYPVNRQAVFSTGMSNGATMTVRLACRSAKIKAVATVASTAVENVIDHCTSEHPIPALLIKGTKDPIANFNGVQRPKRDIAGFHYTVQKFLSIDGCKNTFTVSPIPNRSNDGMTSTKKNYRDCKGTSEVESIVVKNGGHTWPGAPQLRSKFLVGHTTHDFSASTMIWQFFKRHQRSYDQ